MSTHPPFILHQPKHQQPDQAELHKAHPHQARLPVIPDLRFEHSYLRSIQRYVTIHRQDGEHRDDAIEAGEKKEDKEFEPSTLGYLSEEVIHIQWSRVAWITIRDQVISPFLTGTLWALASYFVMPYSAQLGSKAGSFARSRLSSSKEGSGAGWLRGWVSRLGLGTSTISTAKPR